MPGPVSRLLPLRGLVISRFVSEAWPPVALVVLPVLLKLHLLTGLLRARPMLLYSGLATGLPNGWWSGSPSYPTIDPNIGFTSEALGRRAVLDLLSGHMPWWNPFEGVGMPLAGEMQSAALFPLTLLLALRDGQLYEHVAFQIIAGLSTYYLLRQLPVARLPAFAGAAAFAFNGAFAWLANAAINPIPFLPLLLLGIERAAAFAQSRRPGGAAWITVALALSLYAGFPEVAYLNGLLAGVWFVIRACTVENPARWAFVGKVAAAGIAGLLIAAPVLVAFVDYLSVATVGMHDGDDYLRYHLSIGALPTFTFPYLIGGIFHVAAHTQFWGSVGGYAGGTMCALAFAGLFGSSQRALRWGLAVWVAVALGLTFGVPGLLWIREFVPGLRNTNVMRYLTASCAMALCVLAALALDDARRLRWRWLVTGGFALVGVALAVAIFVPGATSPPVLADEIARTSLIIIIAVLSVGMVASRLHDNITRVGVWTILLVVEAMIWFVIPTLSLPRRGAVAWDGIRFLQTHVGLSRVASVGPLAPNYGSALGIASVNHNDLPLPSAWPPYVRKYLDPNSDPVVFNGVNRADETGESGLDALRRHWPAFAAIGVRYAIVWSGQSMAGLPEVFRDVVMRVYELPGAAPYASAPDCSVALSDRTRLHTTCGAPATLQRLEFNMPGWRATVNGAPAKIETSGEIFQSISVPAGEADIVFTFRPPYMRGAYVAFACGALVLIGTSLRARMSTTPNRPTFPSSSDDLYSLS